MFVLWFYLNKTKTILLTCDVERKILEIGVLYLGKYRPRYDIRTESNLFSDIVPWSILGLGDGLVMLQAVCFSKNESVSREKMRTFHIVSMKWKVMP